MTSSRAIRATLQGLAGHGVLIGYTVSMHFGQCVRVWLPNDLPVVMRPGTAAAYLRELDDRTWWA